MNIDWQSVADACPVSWALFVEHVVKKVGRECYVMVLNPTTVALAFPDKNVSVLGMTYELLTSFFDSHRFYVNMGCTNEGRTWAYSISGDIRPPFVSEPLESRAQALSLSFAAAFKMLDKLYTAKEKIN